MTSFNIPEIVADTAKTLENKGFEAYLVGGCVRDLFLGKTPKDWDIATNASPDEIIAAFPKTYYENSFGTVSIVNEEEEDPSLKVIEITPYRSEGAYTDKRRPDSVDFVKKIDKDLERRDFTINAMAYSVSSDALVDPFEGKKDLISGVLRAVGNPAERFEEDALRIMRGVRFHAKQGFTIEPETLKAMKDKARLLQFVSKERIRDEFIGIIESPKPSLGLVMAKDLDILRFIVPELEEGIGIEQNQAHAFDVWTHLIKSLDHGAEKGYPFHVKLAALLHDIGKPISRRKGPNGDWTFYGHEVVGARMTKKILADLRFPKDISQKVVTLVRWHMFFSDTEQITLSAVRRLLANVGEELIWDLMNLRVCDRIGTGRPKAHPYRLRKFQSMIEEVLRDPVSVGMLKVDGNDLMELGEKPGRRIGLILHALLDAVLEDPGLNDKDALLGKAKEMMGLKDAELIKLGERGKKTKEEREGEELSRLRSKYGVR